MSPTCITPGCGNEVDGLRCTACLAKPAARSRPRTAGVPAASPADGAGSGRTEHEEQAAVIAWAEANTRRYPGLELLHAIPNASKRSRRQRTELLDEGLQKGVPDLSLPVARAGYIGLYIEMKRRKARVTKTQGVKWDPTRPTPAQLEWHRRLREAGNAVAICWSAEEAQDVITRYLAGDFTPAT